MVDATRVDMNIEGSRLKAVGEAKRLVVSVMQPAKDSKEGRRTPSIMRQDQPVSGLSRELVYTGGADSSAEFIGTVTLVQGEKIDTKIQAEKILLNSKNGNLSAEGSVLSLMNVQDLNPTTKEREVKKSTGQGQTMLYDDASRKVTYTTKARLIGPHGDLIGDSIVLTLGANGQDVERLDAAGEVKLTEVNRITTGDVLTYVAASDEYNMSGKGKLVRMLSTTSEGCKKSEGQRLTFSRATDTLRIDGSVETRTQTSADNSCTPAKR
jgi:lipopolysaccharide export system protein LptA